MPICKCLRPRGLPKGPIPIHAFNKHPLSINYVSCTLPSSSSQWSKKDSSRVIKSVLFGEERQGPTEAYNKQPGTKDVFP